MAHENADRGGSGRRFRAGTAEVTEREQRTRPPITVARSRLIDHMRAQQRRERKLSMAWSAAEQGERQGIVLDDAPSADMGAATERALGELAEAERCVLVLHHLDGLSVADVADSIGRSVRATESLLARARRKFRAAFEETTDA